MCKCNLQVVGSETEIGGPSYMVNIDGLISTLQRRTVFTVASERFGFVSARIIGAPALCLALSYSVLLCLALSCSALLYSAAVAFLVLVLCLCVGNCHFGNLFAFWNMFSNMRCPAFIIAGYGLNIYGVTTSILSTVRLSNTRDHNISHLPHELNTVCIL